MGANTRRFPLEIAKSVCLQSVIANKNGFLCPLELKDIITLLVWSRRIE